MVVLANDGISAVGKENLEKAGFTVLEVKVAQEQLAQFIKDEKVAVLLVRSATKVTKQLIDSCANLKLIGRGGVGLDNIDVAHAKKKGVTVINTPAASSRSVAELVFAHIFTGVRHLQDANRNMPLEGDSKFKELKKSYASATELKGKMLGVIGFGRIGQEVARIALGLGMHVCLHNKTQQTYPVHIGFVDGQSVTIHLEDQPFEKVLEQADVISIHIPKQEKYLFAAKEYALMKKGVGIINAARGGLIDEDALLQALDRGQVGFAGLDVFEGEPSPKLRLLMHPSVSLSPHVGGTTLEAQERIGMELAEQVISYFEKK